MFSIVQVETVCEHRDRLAETIDGKVAIVLEEYQAAWLAGWLEAKGAMGEGWAHELAETLKNANAVRRTP